ncbi:hypothetical protein IE53DRAFT_388766 [Violaceomyces palustris]|uniref:Uncharacterized protein n=1 Tax=Violaceomyces palustris TaxID=1673888 RepID=A0ACD0NT61_9BASI|nr:hypothetical protein IE53DRAFT_388766 [Violaceomyces palustris]
MPPASGPTHSNPLSQRSDPTLLRPSSPSSSTPLNQLVGKDRHESRPTYVKSPLPRFDAIDKSVLLLSTCVKLLLFPTYHSTDFEVHRNWLAITLSLPVNQWYFESTSQWTLDYPPFFAYFSYLLALPAQFVDPLIVSLHEGLEYQAWSCKSYMRFTVILTELVLAAALWAYSRPSPPNRTQTLVDQDPTTLRLLCASLLLHPGLLIIDHIHFQYNGFLFGVLVWSLWAARQSRPLLSAFLFSSLLNLKHIYVYIAPPYLVYLLRSHVMKPSPAPPSAAGGASSGFQRALERLLLLGLVTLLPFAFSLVPLLLTGLDHPAGPIGVVSQMVSRLFPFSRGLNHAYWAPNAWALWTFVDRVLLKLIQTRPGLLEYLPRNLEQRFRLSSASAAVKSTSRGLVGDTSFGVLPDIRPSTCFLITLTLTSIYLVKLWQRPDYKSFLSSIVLCGFTSFLFGWHVHEKAIMMVLVPLTLLARESHSNYRSFVIVNTAGVVSLFPLLHRSQETPIKLSISLLWSLVVLSSLRKRVYRPVTKNLGLLIHHLENAYLYGFLALQVYVSLVHPLIFPPTDTVNVPTFTAKSEGPSPTRLLPNPTLSTLFDHGFAKVAHQDRGSIPIQGRISEEGFPTGEASDMVADLVEGNEEVGNVVSNIDSAIPEPKTTTTFSIQDQPTWDQREAGLGQGRKVDHPESLPRTRKDGEGRREEEKEGGGENDNNRLEFLPLMLTSVYCSLGVVWSWLRFSYHFLID